MGGGLKLLSRLPLASSNCSVSHLSFSFCSVSTQLCESNPEPFSQPFIFNDDKAPYNHEQLHKLRLLLQQGRMESAYRIVKFLVISKSPFPSPCELLSSLSVSCPSLKTTLSNMLLSICCESKLHGEAGDLYGLMRRDGILPGFDSVRMLVESLLETKQFNMILDLFTDIVEMGFRPDKFMYAKVIQAAVKVGDTKRAMELLDSMKSRGVSPNVFVYNVVLGRLCKEKRIKDAEKVFDEMCRRRLWANTVTYNTLIDGYCKLGEVNKAFNLRDRMKNENVEPSVVTFNSLLSGLCKLGRTIEARRLLEEMRENGFLPDGFYV